MTPDWRTVLLAEATALPVPALARNPSGLPGYTPRASVTAWRLAGGRAVAAVWDFTVHGGSFGEDDASVLAAAAGAARAERVPLVTLVRSGGTRLQEGMAALVGIPRARLALLELAAAGVAHVSVADAPTTGGVWISVASAADVRVAVEGATVGFAGPRVVEAVTGSLPATGSHTAASAAAAGLVDGALPRDQVVGWLETVLTALTPEPVDVGPVPPTLPPQPAGGWEQVLRARARTRSGRTLLEQLVTDRVVLAAPHGDPTVAASLGRLAGRPVVGVALAAGLRAAPTADGYRLAARAYRLAGRLGLPVVSLVDTPGADPTTAGEQDGIAPAMAEALDALLTCPTATVALVHGEGGSGGALAAAACDVVLLTPDSYFAALGPEGASAALRRPAAECAELLRLTPAHLLELGAADALIDDLAAVGQHLAALETVDPAHRRARRTARWAAPLPGALANT